MRAVLLASALLLIAPSLPPAHAQDNGGYGERDEGQDYRDQVNLLWVSGYQGPLSGRMGPRAREAAARFQGSRGFVRSGVLSDVQRDELEQLAVAEKRRLGWRMRVDVPTGMRIGLPDAYVDGSSRKESGTEYRGTRGAFLLRTMVRQADGTGALREQLDAVVEAVRGQGHAVTYSTLKDDWFVVNASNRATSTDVYVRMHAVGGWIKGYMLFTRQDASFLGALVPAVSLSLDAAAEEPAYSPPPRRPAPNPEPPATAAAAPSPEPRKTAKGPSTGSGFVVAAGRVLTNHHVVDGCSRLEVAGAGSARVLARDERNDLALVEAAGVTGKPLAFAPEPAKLGEDVLAMGYPLGALLGNRINITQGIVSSTEGLAGDWTNLQVSVPVQPGNSGGPLLDTEGRVKGVVVAKLKARLLASGEVLVPEQVNFAIKNEMVRGFLKGNSVEARELPSGGKEARKVAADIAETTRPSVVQIICNGRE